ncbi:hypothetical protein DENIT_13063 [Pseudomonas veronii]|nr:hypothetical protein DENIT_13063 [Pseudomonas veronii]
MVVLRNDMQDSSQQELLVLGFLGNI